jgi:hypothetical protein
MEPAISLSEAAKLLSGLGGEVVAITAAGDDLNERPTRELRFRQGDDVTVIYRALEGRPRKVSVMYGANAREVVQALCRNLDRPPERLIARPVGNPFPADRAWIHDAEGRVPGEQLAQVRGLSWVWLNIVLKKPTSLPNRLCTASPMASAEPAFTVDPDTDGDDQ